MKKMLPESELARDERFIRTKIEDRLFDPRGPKIAQRNTGPAKMGVDRPAAGERSRSLMHGIFVGEIQALEGAGRTVYDFDEDTAPSQPKSDMAGQATRTRSNPRGVSANSRVSPRRKTTRWPHSPANRPSRRARWPRWRPPRSTHPRKVRNRVKVTVSPDPFTLIKYDPGVIAG